MEHDTLRILGRTGDPMPWVLTRGEQRWEGIPPGRATANSPELLMRMALEGAGIAVVNDHFALPYLQRGELVQVLPDWRLPPVSAWAVFPGRRLMPARTRVFLDALAAKFTGPGVSGDRSRRREDQDAVAGSSLALKDQRRQVELLQVLREVRLRERLDAVVGILGAGLHRPQAERVADACETCRAGSTRWGVFTLRSAWRGRGSLSRLRERARVRESWHYIHPSYRASWSSIPASAHADPRSRTRAVTQHESATCARNHPARAEQPSP